MNTTAITQTHVDLAREAFVGDMDTFAEWLGAACFGRDKVSAERFLRLTHTLAEGTVADWLQIAVFAVGSATAEERIAALEAIRQHYEFEKRDYLRRLEDEMVAEYPVERAVLGERA